MEKPEIRIEGNIDEKKIQEYLEGIDMSQHPHLKKLLESNNIEELDASKLSLEANELDDDLLIIEPHTEINNTKDYSEIVFEIPGISKEDVNIDFSEEGSELIFKAENDTRKYVKNVNLPFLVSTKDYDIEVKNGLAIILVKRI
jgi:HSP20 family molecular chaperone IbpA